MTHRTYAEIGKHLLSGWGCDDNGDLSAKIKLLQPDRVTVCLLAFIANELQDINREVNWFRHMLREDITASNKKAMSDKSKNAEDGMLQWMLGHRGDMRIEDMDHSKLSVRARKALRRSEITLRSQITRESLENIKNCGEQTIRDLLEWAEGKL
jgi:DNA-directed RNA polymerase alpha subunit